MADEHIPPDWRDLINARLDYEARQRKMRNRQHAQARAPRLSDEEYRKEYWGDD